MLFDVVQCCPGKNPEGKGNDLETYSWMFWPIDHCMLKRPWPITTCIQILSWKLQDSDSLIYYYTYTNTLMIGIALTMKQFNTLFFGVLICAMPHLKIKQFQFHPRFSRVFCRRRLGNWCRQLQRVVALVSWPCCNLVPRAATVVAKENSSVWVIDRKNFKESLGLTKIHVGVVVSLVKMYSYLWKFVRIFVISVAFRCHIKWAVAYWTLAGNLDEGVRREDSRASFLKMFLKSFVFCPSRCWFLQFCHSPSLTNYNEHVD